MASSTSSTSRAKGTSAATLNKARKARGTTPNGGGKGKARKRTGPATTAPPVSGNQREKMQARMDELTSQKSGMSGKESAEVQRLKAALEADQPVKGKGKGKAASKGKGSSSNGRSPADPTHVKAADTGNALLGKARLRHTHIAQVAAVVKAQPLPAVTGGATVRQLTAVAKGSDKGGPDEQGRKALREMGTRLNRCAGRKLAAALVGYDKAR